MLEQMYDNLWLLFQDMKDHTNSCQSKLVSCDDPKSLKIGWYCEKTEYCFRVRVSDIKTRKALKFPLENDMDQLAVKLLTEMIIDKEGRQRIAELMSWNGTDCSGIEVFNRLIKLKAFW